MLVIILITGLSDPDLNIYMCNIAGILPCETFNPQRNDPTCISCIHENVTVWLTLLLYHSSAMQLSGLFMEIFTMLHRLSMLQSVRISLTHAGWQSSKKSEMHVGY